VKKYHTYMYQCPMDTFFHFYMWLIFLVYQSIKKKGQDLFWSLFKISFNIFWKSVHMQGSNHYTTNVVHIILKNIYRIQDQVDHNLIHCFFITFAKLDGWNIAQSCQATITHSLAQNDVLETLSTVLFEV
jgi:hypothetical protein